LSLPVKGKRGSQRRAGGTALSLLAAPLNVCILRALAEEPTALAEVRMSTGAPPQTTMRKQLTALAEAGIVAKERKSGFPGTVRYELRKPGADLLGVAQAVEGWLAAAPDGPVELGTPAAKSALKALVDGWSTTLLRALAARPLNLTELDALIAGVSYPSLERRLLAMRMAGLVRAVTGRGRGTPYEVTEWLRRAVGPLVSAACWERRHLPTATAPIGRIDVESAFLLSLPLLTLDPDLSGLCKLAVVTSSQGDGAVGALAGIEEGRIAYCRARLEGDATARVSGSVTAWFKAVAEGSIDRLEAGGDRLLASAILDGLHASLARPVAA
jgi:DNA-binding HxlR family transcriptional regulator